MPSLAKVDVDRLRDVGLSVSCRVEASEDAFAEIVVAKVADEVPASPVVEIEFATQVIQVRIWADELRGDRRAGRAYRLDVVPWR